MNVNAELSELRDDLQRLKAEIINDVEQKFTEATHRLLAELLRYQGEFSRGSNNHREKNCRRRERPSGPDDLPAKIFILRDSTLTNMWRVNHLNSMYYLVLACVVLLILTSGATYLVDPLKLQEDLELFAWASGKFNVVVLTWIGIQACTTLIFYPGFYFWANSRLNSSSKSGLSNVFWLSVFVLYLSAMIVVPSYTVIHWDLPIISSFIVLTEQWRMLMKTYSFGRENIPRILNHKPHQDGDDRGILACLHFHHFLYFLFVPTLVYRDTYPRTSSIRWFNVLRHFLDFFACLFLMYLTFKHLIIYSFRNVGLHPLYPSTSVMAYLSSVLFGAVGLILEMYALLHCWMNAFAEMLQFGDREFYQDWWNSTSYSQYYRRWNSVIHDFLYTYVYRDLYKVTGKRRSTSLILSIVISSVIHEIILMFAFKYCYPVLGVIYLTVGLPVLFFTRGKISPRWNCFFWLLLLAGMGIIINLLALEYYARVNCKPYIHSSLDFIIPRSWTCSIFAFSK